ncbi:MAG: tRNA-dihydrouridine synthase family protein, partial [Planctomycetes bacterium]|nr:tRNA-dihydrouridine synthase family protein [Planctomycetota bacterium]
MPAVPAAIPPLIITGRAASVSFATPVLLAPMEGITEAVFRELVIDLGGVGGACTEFIRVSSSAIPRKVIARHLGAQPAACPVGVQLMAPDAEHIQATIEAAASAGAPWIDLNFGCPAPVVFDKCAGSALLAHPERVGAIIAAAVAATEVPVSAKIRAGVADSSRLDDLVLAAIEAGAAMLTVHARLRTHAYTHPATWAWIARARALIDRSGRRVLLVGNGGVDHHD